MDWSQISKILANPNLYLWQLSLFLSKFLIFFNYSLSSYSLLAQPTLWQILIFLSIFIRLHLSIKDGNFHIIFGNCSRWDSRISYKQKAVETENLFDSLLILQHCSVNLEHIKTCDDSDLRDNFEDFSIEKLMLHCLTISKSSNWCKSFFLFIFGTLSVLLLVSCFFFYKTVDFHW